MPIASFYPPPGRLASSWRAGRAFLYSSPLAMTEPPPVQDRLQPSTTHAWLVVALCFVALSFAMSARSALGLVMPVWEAELGWSRGFVSTVGAAMLVVIAIVAPFAGNALDRVGPRALFTGGIALLAVGLLLTATATSRWQFFLYFGLLGALGFGVVANHVVSTTVALYFHENRGLATGAATAGSTAGQLVLVPVLALVLSTVGWRPSIAVVGAGALLLAPVAWFLIAPGRPETARRAAAKPAEPLGVRLHFLIRSPTFHALFWSFGICGFTTTGVIETHLLPYTAACGFPPLEGATAYGVLAGFNMLGMLAAGWLADRVNRPLLLAAIYVLRGLAFILLMRITGDLPMLMIFAVAFGLFDYSTFPVTASLVASHLGLRIMGLSMGLLSAAHALGAAAGAFLGGWLFDLFARYDGVWTASIALSIAARLMVLTIRERRAGEGAPRLAPA
jgi:MFS family permease